MEQLRGQGDFAKPTRSAAMMARRLSPSPDGLDDRVALDSTNPALPFGAKWGWSVAPRHLPMGVEDMWYYRVEISYRTIS